MNKDDFIQILECSLLSFDGLTLKELVEKHNFNPLIAKIGVKLATFLKSKEIKND